MQLSKHNLAIECEFNEKSLNNRWKINLNAISHLCQPIVFLRILHGLFI